MRAAFFLSILILVFSLLPACTRKESRKETRTLTVSILPQKYITEKITGDDYDVKVLLPPGANHETYEPTPMDMRSLENSKFYVTLGLLDFEKNWLKRFTEMYPGMTVINTSEGIELLTGHIHEHDGGSGHNHEHENEGIDPHIWLSPSAVKVQARTITHALMDADSLNAESLSERLSTLERMIDSLDLQIKQILQPYKGKAFMIFHPALGYFARDYGLEQISIEEDGKEPSASRISQLIEIAKEKDIRSILISKEFDVRNAETIAKELNAKVITFDPMAEDWPVNMITLAKLIAEN